jgi:citronellol/citronellal dehydrogenase
VPIPRIGAELQGADPQDRYKNQGGLDGKAERKNHYYHGSQSRHWGGDIVVAAKTDTPHPKLPGTIHTVAEKIAEVGGKALPVRVDVRSEESVDEMVSKAVEAFGGIDILVNNAGAISLTPTDATPMKRYDLMHMINARAVFLCSQKVLPYLKKSDHAHILNLSPPLNMKSHWFQNHSAYTVSKYGMTMYTIGMSAEFEEFGIAVNSLWPRTMVATAAVDMLMGEAGRPMSRTPQIMADAAYEILTTPGRELTGQTIIDEEILKERGVTDLDQYVCVPGGELQTDIFIDVE